MKKQKIIDIGFCLVGCLLGVVGVACLLVGRRIDGQGFLISTAFCWLIVLMIRVDTLIRSHWAMVNTEGLIIEALDQLRRDNEAHVSRQFVEGDRS